MQKYRIFLVYIQKKHIFIHCTNYIIITTMIPENLPSQKQAKTAPKKNLLKYQKPIYQLKRTQQGKVQSIIANLMQKKQKPQIGFIQRSSLLAQLDQFIPALQESNKILLRQQIKPEQKLDAKLQEIPDSSSSSDSDADEELPEESERMDIEPEQQPVYLQSCQEFQFNILTYPYLNSKEQASVETKHNQQEKTQPKFKIIQINNTKCGQLVNQLQKMQ